MVAKPAKTERRLVVRESAMRVGEANAAIATAPAPRRRANTCPHAALESAVSLGTAPCTGVAMFVAARTTSANTSQASLRS